MLNDFDVFFHDVFLSDLSSAWLNMGLFDLILLVEILFRCIFRIHETRSHIINLLII